MAKNRTFKLPLKKTPNFTVAPPNYDDLKPAFSFRDMQYQGKVCLSTCDDKSKAAIADRLLRLSQLTWKQIHSLPKDKLGYEPIPYDSFKVTLPLTFTKETTLLVFRFSAAGRMAGYRINDTFHIVAVSPTHSLY